MPLATMFGLTIVAEIALQQRLLRQLADCGVSEFYTLECIGRGRNAHSDIEGRGTHVRIEALTDEDMADKVVRTLKTEGYPVDLFISEVMVKARKKEAGDTGRASRLSRTVSWAKDLISM